MIEDTIRHFRSELIYECEIEKGVDFIDRFLIFELFKGINFPFYCTHYYHISLLCQYMCQFEIVSPIDTLKTPNVASTNIFEPEPEPDPEP